MISLNQDFKIKIGYRYFYTKTKHNYIMKIIKTASLDSLKKQIFYRSKIDIELALTGKKSKTSCKDFRLNPLGDKLEGYFFSLADFYLLLF